MNVDNIVAVCRVSRQLGKMSDPNGVKRKRGSNVTHYQKETLMEYMSNHEDLRKGAFTKNFTKKDQQRQWQDLAEILNAMPGATRTWEKWRKV